MNRFLLAGALAGAALLSSGCSVIKYRFRIDAEEAPGIDRVKTEQALTCRELAVTFVPGEGQADAEWSVDAATWSTHVAEFQSYYRAMLPDRLRKNGLSRAVSWVGPGDAVAEGLLVETELFWLSKGEAWAVAGNPEPALGSWRVSITDAATGERLYRSTAQGDSRIGSVSLAGFGQRINAILWHAVHQIVELLRRGPLGVGEHDQRGARR